MVRSSSATIAAWPCSIGSGMAGGSNPEAALYAFDLLEIEGEDLRNVSIEMRKRKLARLLEGAKPGLQISEHLHGNGAEIFLHACQLGCEGIVSKRLGSRYTSGRTDSWIKVKNPTAPAVKREAEEDWGR
jgi:bifunctional non-homologous end joining protein LigD